MAPCCIGKIATTTNDPYLYRATAQHNNRSLIAYPQSTFLTTPLLLPPYHHHHHHSPSNVIGKEEQLSIWFNALAKAADVHSTDFCRTSRFATRRMAKSIIEMERKSAIILIIL